MPDLRKYIKRNIKLTQYFGQIKSLYVRPINQIFMHLLQKKFVYHTFYQII